MGEKMNNAPVYFTIVQARFNNLWALDTFAPTIQENMRKAGYPDAKKTMLTTINFNINPIQSPLDPGQQQVPVTLTARYIFANIENTSAFMLDQGALTYQTSSYETFEAFLAEFLKGLEAIHTIVNLNFIERVGVRYLDAITPKDMEQLADYLQPSVLGLLDRLDGDLVHSFSETVTRTLVGNITSRTIIENGPIGVPPDLQPLPVKIPQKLSTYNGLHAVLDTDGGWELREVFDLLKIKKQLTSIHHEISKSFKATITQFALDVWK